MKTLILPDIHHKIALAQSLINNIEHDKVIHLGDHQDDFGDGPEQAINTMLWTKQRIEAGDTFILGNHDLMYMFPNAKFICSGYTRSKAIALSGKFQDVLTRINLWVREQGWWLSHAGFQPKWVKNGKPLYSSEDLLASLLAGEAPPMATEVGECRGGEMRAKGGLTWLDWYDEFEDIPGFPQIVGHSQGRQPRQKGVSWCIDTGLHHYGMITDGEFSVHEV